MTYINVMYDSLLTSGEKTAVSDALSEIWNALDEYGLMDELTIRLFGSSDFRQNGRVFSTLYYLNLAKSYPLRSNTNRKPERLINANDLVDVISRREPYFKEPCFTILLTAHPIMVTPSYGALEKRYSYSENNVCILSVAPYHEEKLTPNDEYQVIKLMVARELGLMLGALKHRREKVSWRDGEVACASKLCAINRADSIIQKMGLARRLDISYTVYCSHCMNNIKRFYHLPTQP